MKKTHFFHPGEIIRTEFLDPYGLSVKAAAEAMHMPRSRLNDIVRGARGVTADTALRLARFFGAAPQFWLNLQSRYDLAEAEAQARTARVARSLKAIRPVAECVEARG
jgi:addiction module HigA family antidote